MKTESQEFARALFSKLEKQAEEHVSDYDYFKEYLKKYFEDASIELVYTRKDTKERIRYYDILKKFVRAHE